MKFSKPGETKTDESGGNGSDTVDKMPMVESELCNKFAFEPQPVGEMVDTNGGFIARNFDQIDELEGRVEELERKNVELEEENEELRESLNGLIAGLDNAGVLEVNQLP